MIVEERFILLPVEWVEMRRERLRPWCWRPLSASMESEADMPGFEIAETYVVSRAEPNGLQIGTDIMELIENKRQEGYFR